MVKQENGDLFVRLLTNIDGAVNSVSRLVPVNLPRRDAQAMALTPIGVFDGEGIAGQDHSDSMKWVSMPGQCFTGRHPLTTNKDRSTMEENFVAHE